MFYQVQNFFSAYFINSCTYCFIVKIEGHCQGAASNSSANSNVGGGGGNQQSSNSNPGGSGGNGGNQGGNGSGGGASGITGSVLLTALSIGFLCFMKLK